ncbi:phage/plasmid replication protein, II/X family [Pseudomonas sp. PDM20]|uniref:phage/plasmid replication protein, II/X family n=1 Tax=Pseudomonas sp. PDM20 TaxID=2769254 RepID=UPI0017828541|nr:phage/plasmid replication protein, II/X family [Pseudomonas sp. PDM20]MBD9683827.1 replication initiation protein [Pseudomonas sp. PDM20]MBD9683839.1 replication initiation protein [Pseudomonas sp. PDM20]
MLDKLHLFIPFASEHIQLLGADGRDDPVHSVDLATLGVPLQGQISIGEGGKLEAEYLRHAWESLSTGFTPLAFKVFHQSLGKRLMPGIEVKASPAKLLQGHNVFGPTCIQKGAEVMLKWIAGTYPQLFAKLDIAAAQVYAIDCTFSSRLPDERTALQVIQALTNVSNGHTKSRGDNYQTSAYWGAKESRLKRLKAYLKHTEYQAQLDELKRAGRGNLSAARTYRVMSDPRLQEWVRYLLRMEATVMHRWMERRGIPSRLVDLIAHQQQLAGEGRCLIQECWQAVTADLFAAFEGTQMRIVDDEKVLAALTEKFTKLGRNGKPSDAYAKTLFRTYLSIKDYGWDHTKDLAPRTFYRHIKDIAEAGLSKAALQKLQDMDRTNNVVPLLRFVQVDFSAQRPDWYVEPVVEAA